MGSGRRVGRMKELREDVGEKRMRVSEREERRSKESGGKTNKRKKGSRKERGGGKK